MLSKYGVSSRRNAKDIIQAGRVMVDGVVVKDLNRYIDYSNKLSVDGRVLVKEKPRIWVFNKPRLMLITHDTVDHKGRETLGQMLSDMGCLNLHYVGRLDYSSEGLLLLTNSSSLKRYMELPENNFQRKYRARVFGKINANVIEKLKKGVTVDGIRYKGIELVVEKSAGHNSWVTLVLSEGKNREVKKVLKYFNIEVSRLIRLEYGPYKLNNLKEGDLISTKNLKQELIDHLKSINEI